MLLLRQLSAALIARVFGVVAAAPLVRNALKLVACVLVVGGVRVMNQAHRGRSSMGGGAGGSNGSHGAARLSQEQMGRFHRGPHYGRPQTFFLEGVSYDGSVVVFWCGVAVFVEHVPGNLVAS